MLQTQDVLLAVFSYTDGILYKAVEYQQAPQVD